MHRYSQHQVNTWSHDDANTCRNQVTGETLLGNYLINDGFVA
jgi:hypothetical protein